MQVGHKPWSDIRKKMHYSPSIHRPGSALRSGDEKASEQIQISCNASQFQRDSDYQVTFRRPRIKEECEDVLTEEA